MGQRAVEVFLSVPNCRGVAPGLAAKRGPKLHANPMLSQEQREKSQVYRSGCNRYADPATRLV